VNYSIKEQHGIPNHRSLQKVVWGSVHQSSSTSSYSLQIDLHPSDTIVWTLEEQCSNLTHDRQLLLPHTPKYYNIRSLTRIFPTSSCCTELLTYPLSPATMPSATIANLTPELIQNPCVYFCIPPHLQSIRIAPTASKSNSLAAAHSASFVPSPTLIRRPLARPSTLVTLSSPITRSRVDIRTTYTGRVHVPALQLSSTPTTDYEQPHCLHIDTLPLVLHCPLYFALPALQHPLSLQPARHDHFLMRNRPFSTASQHAECTVYPRS
jgi:hypothetical protein